MLADLPLVVYYSLVHVMTPGHSKTLLLAGALSGRERRTMLQYALGFSLAHGFLMALAVAAGFAFKGVLAHIAGNHPDVILKTSLFVLALACCYFVYESWNIYTNNRSEEVHEPREGWLEKHPVLTGIFAGCIPCPDTIGIALVVPNMVIGLGQIVPTLAVVWLTVSGAILGMGAALTLLPIRTSVKRFHIPDWFPAGASAAICMAVIVWRVYYGHA